LTKNCELRIKHFLDEDDEDFEYIGDPFVINLEHYIGKGEIKKDMYFTSKYKSTDIYMVKVVAKITVRPSEN
jgi:nicotinamide mononucleotide adenylyltransferase